MDGRLVPNPYLRSPFRVALYSLHDKRATKTCVFLGDAPRAVLRAARKARWEAGAAAWPAEAARTLENFYGPEWAVLLAPLELGAADGRPVWGGAASDGEGGDTLAASAEAADDTFGDLQQLNLLRRDEDGAVVLDREDLTAASSSARPTSHAPAAAPFPDLFEAESAAAAGAAGLTPAFTSLAVYPQDTLADLKAKVGLALGVPPYRQHFFWRAPGGRSGTTYKVTVGGRPVAPSAATFGAEEGIEHAGLPLDRRFAEAAAAGEVNVVALDAFRLAGAVQGGSAFVADLEELAAPARPALAAAVEDEFLSTLLYNGLVLKYWPQLSPAAARVFFQGGDVAVEFPRLAGEGALATAAGAEAQQALLAQTYAKAAVVEAAAEKAGGRTVAVTGASVTVRPEGGGCRANIRNAFDLLATCPRWPAAASRFFLPTAGGGRHDVTSTKTHVTAALGGNSDAAEIQRLAGRVLRRETLFVVLRVADVLTPQPGSGPSAGDRKTGGDGATKKSTDGGESEDETDADGADSGAAGGGDTDGLVGGRWLRGRPRLLTFTLAADGTYTLTATWSEDRLLRPEGVVPDLTAAVAPLLAFLNSLGAQVFPLGGALEPPRRESEIHNLSAAAYWPQALSEEAFRELKNRWRKYEDAGIVGVRGLQQSTGFAFRFRKGVAAYDPRAIERTVVVTSTVDARGRRRVVREVAEKTQNTYAHLSDPEIAQRWDCLYGGRPVRFLHRTSDVRVELADLTASELDWVWHVVFTFFQGLVAGPARLVRGVYRPGESPALRGLRALQDADPELYDLRRHDSRVPVYSVLCQSPRPPAHYTPAEAASLPERRRRRLVEYWNFTHQRPAFYECGNPRFSHFSFLEGGRHPRGYCLPCCQKTPAHPGSRRDRTTRACFAEFAGDGQAGAAAAAATSEGSGRHSLSYGKAVPPGRVAALSRFLAETVFFGTTGPGEELRLLGVPQSLPAIPAAAGGGAGLFFALAAAAEVPPAEMAETFAAAVERMGAEFTTLAEGRAGLDFASPAAAAAAIRETFAPPPEAGPTFTPFSPGGPAGEYWEALAEELCAACYGLHLVTFDDPGGGDGRGATVRAGRAAAAQFRTGLPTDFAVVFRVGHPDGKAAAGGVYPLAVGGRRPADVRRAAFSAFGPEDPAGGAVAAILAAAPAPPVWDAGALARVLARKKFARRYAVESVLVGTRGLCYAAAVRDHEAQDLVYVAVVMCPPGPLLAAGGKLSQGPRPAAAAGRRATLLKFLAGPLAASGVAAAEVADVAAEGGRRAGRVVRFAPPVGDLNFYHTPEKKKAAPGAALDPGAVDRGAWAARAAPLPARRATTPAARRVAYLAALRPLLLTAFANWLYAEPGRPGPFLARLAEASPAEAAQHVAEALEPLVEKVPEDPAPEVPNLFQGCGRGEGGPCTPAGRLLVPAARFEAYASVLAADLQSPYNRGALPFKTSGVLRGFDFVRRPGERLEVRF